MGPRRTHDGPGRGVYKTDNLGLSPRAFPTPSRRREGGPTEQARNPESGETSYSPFTMKSLIPVLLALSGSLASPLEAQSEPIRALIVSGANNHDWRWTTPSLQRILEASGRFEVAVSYSPGEELARMIPTADVLVLDYNGPRWGEEAERVFLDAVRNGTGVVVIHAANNAFPGWTEYEDMVGDLWRKGTGHGKFHTFAVTVSDRDHPLTETLPDLVLHPDELYHDLWRSPGANHVTLACAHSSTDSGGTGEDEPMILVGSYGAARIFHTPLGHVWEGVEESRASHEDPQFHTVVVQGTEWAATGKIRDGLEHPNHLTAQEASDGWQLLFDGHSTRGWRSWRGTEFPGDGWEVLNGCLRHTKGGGDIATVETYQDFELAFEWKTARGVNSGVKTRVPAGPGAPLGPEYQILDDPGTNEDNNPLSAAAALYAMFPVEGKRLEPTGTFNRSRIVWQGNRVEHWLNGVKVLEAEVGSERWEAAKARSKFKNVAEFATPKKGHIVLQDHGGEVWYRSIRIRELGNPEPESMLTGPGLAGWTPVGGAEWRREGMDIVGMVPDGGLPRNAFLRTDEEFGDFTFEVGVRFEVLGNSGIQFRSHQKENGRVFGYQAEIDPSDRAWSGGIYDEARRGWLCDLKQNPAGRAAFRVDDWNHYRIESRGQELRIWVNGVQTGRLTDDADASGFFALQVHGGARGKIRWRNPRITLH